MNSKEQKIREAYGEYFEELKHIIDEDGWCYLLSKEISNDLGNKMIQVFREEIPAEYKFNHRGRPKYLQGIENNNGWIKIESEDDLPKESGWYDFQIYPQPEYKPNNVFWHAGATKIGWYIETYTHYQKIESKLPPLY